VSVDLLETAAQALGSLVEVVVFLGGASIALWISDPAAPPSHSSERSPAPSVEQKHRGMRPDALVWPITNRGMAEAGLRRAVEIELLSQPGQLGVQAEALRRH
jgi:hypothetical protein